MMNLKVLDINLESKELLLEDEGDVKHIASLTTTEVPLVGARFKMFKECTFEIIEVVYLTSEANVLSTNINNKDYDNCAWGYDKGLVNGKPLYLVGVKVVDGEYKIK